MRVVILVVAIIFVRVKTLTIVPDDDANIDILLSQRLDVGPALSVPTVTVDAEAPPPMTSRLTRTVKWSKKVGSGTAQAQGGSSAYCKKNTGYNCGAVFPPNGDTCGHKGCCCRPEDGTG